MGYPVATIAAHNHTIQIQVHIFTELESFYYFDISVMVVAVIIP